MKNKLLQAWKKGYKEVEKACNFNTCLVLKDKTLKIKSHEFLLVAGIHVFDCEDDLYARWLLVNKMMNDKFVEGIITTEDITRMMFDIEKEKSEV